ncbi:MAG: hypothetical protein RJQ00_13420 [Vicingaceae bacterium]
MKNFPRSFGCIALIGILMLSCTDDYFEFDKIKVDDWKPELAIPLVNSSLTLANIIQKSDTNGIVNPNPTTNILEVIYEGSVFSTKGALVIDIPNQVFEESLQLDAPIPPSPTGGSQQESFQRAIDFDNNNTALEIDSVLLKQGILVINVENSYQHNAILELTFPTFKDNNGDKLVLNFDIPPAPSASSPSVRAITTDLTGFVLNMAEDENGNAAINKYPFLADLTFNLTPNIGSNTNDEIKITGGLNNLAFEKFYGYVGQLDLELDQDSITIDLFKNFVDGTFFIANPFLDVTVSNSFGVPINLTFQKIAGYNPSKNPTEIEAVLPVDPITGQRNVRRLNAPTNFGVAETVIESNKMNSNVADVISYLPKQIIYDAKADFNPNGKTGSRNYLSDTSQIGLDVYLRLPFEGYVSDFKLVDTIDFNFSNNDEIESGLIRMKADNGFPVESEIQVIFTDSNYQAIDSLYPEGQRSVIPSSIINDKGESVQNSIKTTDVTISGERINLLTEGRYAIIKAELQSTNSPNQNVRFFEDYRLDINLGLKATIVIN